MDCEKKKKKKKDIKDNNKKMLSSKRCVFNSFTIIYLLLEAYMHFYFGDSLCSIGTVYVCMGVGQNSMGLLSVAKST